MALTGNQKKIDKNKNNRIDAEDFKILKAEKKMGKPKGMFLGALAIGAIGAKKFLGKKKSATAMPGAQIIGKKGSGMGSMAASLVEKKKAELMGKRRGGVMKAKRGKFNDVKKFAKANFLDVEVCLSPLDSCSKTTLNLTWLACISSPPQSPCVHPQIEIHHSSRRLAHLSWSCRHLRRFLLAPVSPLARQLRKRIQLCVCLSQKDRQLAQRSNCLNPLDPLPKLHFAWPYVNNFRV